MFCRGPLEEHFCKTSVKYLQGDSSKCQFSFFPILSQWQIKVAIATRIFIRLGQKKQCNLLPLPVDAIRELWQESAS